MSKFKTIVWSSKFLVFGYLFTIILLFLYSFTQVDLGLTLTRHPFFLPFQKFFQYIGYFNRPLSTYLYIGIIVLLFLFYFLLLKQVFHKLISSKNVWVLILVTSGILVFSYNAFSYDLFNYIFDAKIFTYYGQNPYEHKALDYPKDIMLSFMHWTHRVYPYGPSWLALTIPLSYIGLQFFLPTFLLFKLVIIVSYIGSVYFVQKISQKLFPSNFLFTTTFFALNPIVLIESLVSAHNDIVMMFFAVLATYLLTERKYQWSIVFLLFSIGIKFGTIFLAPIFIYVFVKNYYRKTVNWEKIMFYSFFVMTIGILFSSYRTEFQPWYFLWTAPFLSLLPYKKEFFVISSVFSIVLLFIYIPFLYTGNWNPQFLYIKNVSVIALFICSLVYLYFNKINKFT